MPNHVYTSMIITGNANIIATFADKHFTDGNFDFSSFVKMPEELENTKSPVDKPNQELIEKYGVDNWYDWKIKNWGTKWGAYDSDMDVSTPNTIECNFQTAWSLPEPIFELIGEMYPELNFQATTVEEGGFFAGTFEIVDGIVDYDGLSNDQAQWKRLAEEMMGWDFSEDEDEERADTITMIDEKIGKGDSMITELGLFAKENIDEFIKFVKSK